MIKLIYKNWEKAMFFAVMALLIAFIFVDAWKTSSFNRKMHEKLIVLETSGLSPEAADYFQEEEKYKDLLEHLKFKPFDAAYAKIKRNIFEKFREEKKVPKNENTIEAIIAAHPEPVFELLQISYKPLDMEYQGRIIFNNGSIIAQLNSKDVTFLVKEGDEIFEFKLTFLDKDFMELRDKKGKIIGLRYQETEYSDELLAKIRENTSATEFLLHKGSEFFGYKVLDISKDNVLLFKQGQEVRLEKGKTLK